MLNRMGLINALMSMGVPARMIDGGQSLHVGRGNRIAKKTPTRARECARRRRQMASGMLNPESCGVAV
ncbi:hypothetical protein SAMN03080615_01658 [Amphritea atlantica]|uniref:Uncharacterized protein n=1 Tax=Amphritea atlantica TaxID=355243 RepID=A0A1H9GFQ8_9GAMM|nr:hypothetical protein [Amphritea atlantica]SEQ48950.1 hypothetical protein SAMN03080615_01658 [Amphritea atlantica]